MEKAGRSVSGSVGVVRLLTRPERKLAGGYGVPGSRPAACAGTGDLVPQVLARLLTAYAGVVGEDRRRFGVMSKAAHIVCLVVAAVLALVVASGSVVPNAAAAPAPRLAFAYDTTRPLGLAEPGRRCPVTAV